jgi:hypothetical protein
LSFKLIQRFLDFGDDETKVFFLYELIEACPYPSMNTAAIGLLKTYIGYARPQFFTPHSVPIDIPNEVNSFNIQKQIDINMEIVYFDFS